MKIIYKNILYTIFEAIGIFIFIIILKFYFPSKENFSLFNLIFGGIFFISGIVINFLAANELKKNLIKINKIKPQKILLKTGIYKFSRNPLSIGVCLEIFGISLLLNFSGSISLLFLVFVIYFIDIILEERSLKKYFGEQYIEYKKKTPRWL
jgi:protein-S-isoprenylcysteine O-methyltransferase Ste14